MVTRQLPVREIREMADHYVVILDDPERGARRAVYVPRQSGAPLSAGTVLERAAEVLRAGAALAAPAGRLIAIPAGSVLSASEGGV